MTTLLAMYYIMLVVCVFFSFHAVSCRYCRMLRTVAVARLSWVSFGQV